MIPFNKSHVVGTESGNIARAIASAPLNGDGPFTKSCHDKLGAMLDGTHAMLTHSATAALELAALVARLGPGDEVIMPSFTFVSTANAVVLRGAVPVFIDIRPDTLNIDASLVEAAITPRTRMIMPVHYAGVACEMDRIMEVARRHRLLVVEDAAQGVLASYHGRPLGSIGDMSAMSFHATKNISCGEGGAFFVRDPELAARAEIVREKGTNRSRFLRGEADKYTWVDVGSSFLPSELNAAYLLAQLEAAVEITRRRLLVWNAYHDAFAAAESRGWVARPHVPADCQHNAHIYYLVLDRQFDRDKVLATMRESGVAATFHYVPLHSSPFGASAGRAQSPMANTDFAAGQLIRLPLWPGVEQFQGQIVDVCLRAINGAARK